MNHILDIALNDLVQIVRDRKVFLFLLIMPICFTLLFGYAFGGFSSGGDSDPRLPVAVLDEDDGRFSQELFALLKGSEVIRIETDLEKSRFDYEKALSDGDLAGIVTIPAGYSQAMLDGQPIPLDLWADQASTTGTTVQNEVLMAAKRLASAVWTAQITSQAAGKTADFDALVSEALLAWQEPPIRIEATSGVVAEEEPSQSVMSMAHTAPGMILQFAIASLLTAAQVIVSERKSRCLQRLLTTATQRVHILMGHFLSIFAMLFTQFMLLIVFGQFILKVDYLRLPGATLLVAVASVLCIAAMGLLIGVLAKSEEQAVMFSLIPMFVLSGLGGAWVPLEFTGAAFQTIGHASPIAWAMDGFKNIIVRGLGLESIWLPVAALVGYAVVFFGLAAWRFRSE